MVFNDLTLSQIRDMAFALRADSWNVTLVHQDEEPPSGMQKAIRVTYPFKTFMHPETVKFMRGRNAHGYHVYGRPAANQYILVDDLCEDALDCMKADGHRPAVIVESSKSNYQAWIAIAKEPVEDAEATAISRLLAQRYGGDMRSAKASQLGRLPGTTNRKAMYQNEDGTFPFTRLVGKRLGYVLVTDAAAQVLMEAREWRSTPSVPSTLKGSVLDQARMSELSADEALVLYRDIEQYLYHTFGTDGFANDRSRLDFAIVQNMKRNGASREDCEAVLIAGSEKTKERGLVYLRQTVRAVYR